jgi:hypothetical protein
MSMTPTQKLLRSNVKRVAIAVVCGAFAGTTIICSAQSPKPPVMATGLDIQIDDVARFYRVYNRAHGHPTAEQLQHDYIDPGSDGLHRLSQLRHVTGVSMAEAIAKYPQIYADARRSLALLAPVRRRVVVALHKLGQLYPEAEFPPVTIAVGRGKPVGVTDAKGVMIGLEALGAVTWLEPNIEDRFVHVIAHEYGHVQQPASGACALQRPQTHSTRSIADRGRSRVYC